MIEELNVLSNSELITLRRNVEQEIVNRRIAKTASIPKGEYVIGEDIPAGTYSVRKGRKDNWTDSFEVYEDRYKKRRLYSFGIPDGGEIGIIVLENGMLVSFDEPFTLTIYSGFAAAFE